MKSGSPTVRVISITDLDKPSSTPIAVPPFRMVEIGTDVIRPAVSMVAGRGASNQPHFDICLVDEWGRQARARYRLPDTITKAVPNATTGEWEYPKETLTLSYTNAPDETPLMKWLQARAGSHLRQRTRANAWPNFPETRDPPPAPEYVIQTETVERDCVVAFIDILGFKEVMKSDDLEIRRKAIHLLEQLTGHSSTHGIKIRDMGIGAQIVVNPEVSTFSDNVVLSIPIRGVSYPTPVGQVTEPAESFMTNLITLCISTFWQGLHLGLLFRGGIARGRLYHASNVVAGAGMVDAVELEKLTRWPRIAISPDVLGIVDQNGRPIIRHDVRELIIQDEEDGTHYLDVFSFHQGVWCDYFHFRGIENGTNSQVRSALQKIKKHTSNTISRLEAEADNADPKRANALREAADKWRWFQTRFEAAQQKGVWENIWNPPEEPPVTTTVHE